MVDTTSTGASASNKSFPSFSRTETDPCGADGVVRHGLISALSQVVILGVVDETGSASIADITSKLADHPNPVGAILALVDADILTLELSAGLLDNHTIVKRVRPNPDPATPGGAAAIAPALAALPTAPPTGMHAELCTTITTLPRARYCAHIHVGTDRERRAFAKIPALKGPGAYVLANATEAYIGFGSALGARIASGNQPIQDVETIIAISDANGRLDDFDGRALERILWSRMAASGEYGLINAIPDGASVAPERYDGLQAMAAQACLGLRQAGMMFCQSSPRQTLAGPLSEPGRQAPARLFNAAPAGEILELAFGDLVALAARQSDGRWVLLAGSDVRIATAASANSTVRFLRAAWLHSGCLTPAPDNARYTLTRDKTFTSGSAVAQFVCGSKGKGLSDWRPIDPDGGYDPDTPRLIAS